MGNPKNEVFIRFMVILQNPNYQNQAKGVFSFRFIEIREIRSDIIPIERSFSGWFIHILRNRADTNETERLLSFGFIVLLEIRRDIVAPARPLVV